MNRSNLAPTDENALFLAEWTAEMRHQHLLNRWLLAIFPGWLALPVLPFFAVPVPVTVLYVSLLLAGTVCLAISYRRSFARMQQLLPGRPFQLKDSELVGLMLEMLDTPNATLRKWAANGLLYLLPHLHEEAGRLWSDHQRACLYRALEPPRLLVFPLHHAFREPLALALLKALEKAGDERDIPVVEHVSLYSEYKAVRRAAQNCLLALNTRCIASLRVQVGRTLLRPVLMDQAALELPRTAPPPSPTGASPR